MSPAAVAACLLHFRPFCSVNNLSGRCCPQGNLDKITVEDQIIEFVVDVFLNYTY